MVGITDIRQKLEHFERIRCDTCHTNSASSPYIHASPPTMAQRRLITLRNHLLGGGGGEDTHNDGNSDESE
jgi:hypothetical protein